MNIDYMPNLDRGNLYATNIYECSKVKDLVFDRIDIGNKFPNWKMHLAHEIGHILHYHYIDKPVPILPQDRTVIQTFRQEVMAWRIAKSLIKPKYWNDFEVIFCLKTYYHEGMPKIKWEKLKIIPFNKGLKLK